jgi:hypothetical protein
MSGDPAFYPIARVIPIADGLRVDEVTERHEAARQWRDMQILIRNVAPRPLPPRPYKTITDTAIHYKQVYVAENAVDWTRELGKLENRPLDSRRQNQ